MVTQIEIEEKAFDYWTNNNRAPRFVLLDKAQYDRLSESFRAKERVVPLSGEGITDISAPKLAYMVTGSGMMQILSVDTTENLFEVVG